MNVYDETMQILQQYKIQANKSLGQNFLINEEVINKIIDEAKISKDDLIIEIGPGLGVLTKRLLEKCNNVIAIELDTRMINILKNRFYYNIQNTNYSKLEIINEDVLKVDLSKIIKEKRIQKNIEKVKVVANLPYYISTPIIMKLLEDRLNINQIIVMVQKEVAERLTAKTGTRVSGAITHVAEYYSNAIPIVKVPKESFIPSPKVESEVIKLEIRANPKITVKNEKMLFNIIQKSFMQRRKTLANALVNFNIVKSKDEVDKIFNMLKINKNIRGENLTLEDFAKISDIIN